MEPFVGDVLAVEITRLEPHGIWIEHEGQKGFVQIVDASWDTFGIQQRLGDLFKVGQQVCAKVMSVDGEMFFASIKDAHADKNPWSSENSMRVGQRLQGTVVLVADYGYIVKLSTAAIAVLETDRVFAKGDTVDVVVSSVDRENKRAQLTL